MQDTPVFVLIHLKKAVRNVKLLLGDVRAAKRPPVFVVGMPRSGTTWLASTIATARSVRYYHEPFNCNHIAGTEAHYLKYLQHNSEDAEFAAHCRRAFRGQGPFVHKKIITGRHRRFSWWPGRVLVKDVHALLALGWIDYHIQPATVLIARHPCGVAASWSRLGWSNSAKRLQRLLRQPALIEDYLSPFEALMQKAGSYFETLGAFWGAVNYVMLQQQKQRPDWTVVKHESLCRDPEGEFRDIFHDLDLCWTKQTSMFLHSSTKRRGKRYTTERFSQKEPEKWRRELTPDQIQQVRDFARPFNISLYPEI